MKWYYVVQGQQTGPVSDADLSRLYQEGVITADTLVRSGELEQWIPFRDAKLEIAPPAAAIASDPAAPPLIDKSPNLNEVVCAECGRIFPVEETIRHGNAYVCAGCKPVFLQKLAEGARVNTGELQYAGFWIRVAAKFVDGLILGVPFIIVYALAIPWAFHPPARGEQPSFAATFLPLLLNVLFVFIKVAYEVFFLTRYGATPGKMVCKLQVVTAEGGRISFGRAAGRAFAEMLSAMICYIGYIMVGFDEQKRGLHDHICNTRVVYKDK